MTRKNRRHTMNECTQEKALKIVFLGYSNVPQLIFMHLCLVSAGQAISEPGTDHLDAAGRHPDASISITSKRL